MKTYTLILVIIILNSFCISAQKDTVLLLNGEIVTGKLITNDNQTININVKKIFKNKIINIDKEDIFSLNINGKDSILYSQDSSLGYNFTKNQMRSFIKGMQTAKKNYKPILTTIGGFFAGFTGGGFGFWGIGIPTTYVLMSGIKSPKLKTDFIIDSLDNNFFVADSKPRIGYNEHVKFHNKKSKLNTEFSQNKYFKYGYETKAKDKKIKGAIKGGIIGVITFIIISYTVL